MKLAASVAPLRRGLPARRRRVLRRGRRSRRTASRRSWPAPPLALCESGEEFSISASHGVVLLPHEAATLEQALQLADERMYSHKHGRSGAREQARDVLMRTMQAKQPDLREHSSEVADLAVAVARRLGMDGEEIDEIARAAELHDVGKVGIPDVILDKPAGLDATEWELMHQHTILGERILNAAPGAASGRAHRALDPRALGRPRLSRRAARRRDPAGARVVAVCDAYDAMTTDRAYSARDGPRGRLPGAARHGRQPVRPAGRRGLHRRGRRARRAARPRRGTSRFRCRCSPIACARCSDRPSLRHATHLPRLPRAATRR